MNMLRRGEEWLSGKMLAHASGDVEYVRAESSVGLPAVIGRTPFEEADEHGVIRRSESRDFIFSASSLILDDEITTPRKGDRIRELIGDKWQIYQVGTQGSEPAFRFTDTSRRVIRVHTFHVGEETA